MSAVPLPRDIRVDEIGHAAELQQRVQRVSDLKTQVKCRMMQEGIDRLEGALFEAVLVENDLKLSLRVTRKTEPNHE